MTNIAFPSITIQSPEVGVGEGIYILIHLPYYLGEHEIVYISKVQSLSLRARRAWQSPPTLSLPLEGGGLGGGVIAPLSHE